MSKKRFFIGAALVLAGCSGSPTANQTIALPLSAKAAQTHHVAGRIPIQGRSVEIAADRTIGSTHASYDMTVPAKANKWTLQATLPGAVIHDISFPTASVGYVAAEAGQVWKTSDGGVTWTEILNLSFPYYWYGVAALNARDVVISGFIDSSNSQEAVMRWSHDGGATWSNDIILSPDDWLSRVRFVDSKNGLALGQFINPALAYYTSNGGATAKDWTSVLPDQNSGWFGNEFSFLPNLHARASGINYCSSINGGKAWNCGPSIDSVFDGAVFFANDKSGWVGGGEISPSVAGWVHRTTDGGKTWSARTLNSPFPIRELLFATPKTGWAAGGNIFSKVGGIYFSSDGGQTWKLDLNTHGYEIDSCDRRKVSQGTRVWCTGSSYTSNFTGAVYTTLYPKV